MAHKAPKKGKNWRTTLEYSVTDSKTLTHMQQKLHKPVKVGDEMISPYEFFHKVYGSSCSIKLGRRT